VAARLPRAAAKRPATGEIRNSFLPSSPSSPAATTPLPAKTTKNAASKSVAAFLSLFSVRLLFLQICQFWSRALHAPPTDQACGWLDRQLSSSHFISATAVLSTAAMVVRSAPIQTSVFCPFFTILWPSFSFPHCLCNELLEKGRCCCWPVDGGPLLREEGEAKGEQLRYGRLWLALGLRGRPMNGGLPWLLWFGWRRYRLLGCGLCFGQRESRDVEMLSGFSFQRERGGLRLCLARRGENGGWPWFSWSFKREGEMTQGRRWRLLLVSRVAAAEKMKAWVFYLSGGCRGEKV